MSLVWKIQHAWLGHKYNKASAQTIRFGFMQHAKKKKGDGRQTRGLSQCHLTLPGDRRPSPDRTQYTYCGYYSDCTVGSCDWSRLRSWADTMWDTIIDREEAVARKSQKPKKAITRERQFRQTWWRPRWLSSLRHRPPPLSPPLAIGTPLATSATASEHAGPWHTQYLVDNPRGKVASDGNGRPLDRPGRRWKVWVITTSHFGVSLDVLRPCAKPAQWNFWMFHHIYCIRLHRPPEQMPSRAWLGGEW